MRSPMGASSLAGSLTGPLMASVDDLEPLVVVVVVE